MTRAQAIEDALLTVQQALRLHAHWQPTMPQGLLDTIEKALNHRCDETKFQKFERPVLGQIVVMDDIDNGTSYQGTVVDAGRMDVQVEWHEKLAGEDDRTWVPVTSLRGYSPEDAERKAVRS